MRVIVCENHPNNTPWRIIDLITIADDRNWLYYSPKYALAGHKKVCYMPATKSGKEWYANNGYV